MNRVMQWGGLLGFGLVIGGQYFSNMPYSLYPKSEFWLDSPGLIVIKLGVVMLVIGFAYLWTALPLARPGAGCGSWAPRRCWFTGCTSNWCTAAGSAG